MSRYVVPKHDLPGEVPFGRKLSVKVEKGRLFIYRKGEEIFEGAAELDYEVHCTPDVTEVRVLEPPRGKGANLLGWLCGAPNMACVTSEDAYRKRVNKYKKRRRPVKTWECKGDGYCFFWSRKENIGSQNYCVAFYIASDITVPAIISMVPMMCKAGYTKDYIVNLLMTRYGLSETQLQDAIKETDL